jgi:lysophospholipase L1-like esterase
MVRSDTGAPIRVSFPTPVPATQTPPATVSCSPSADSEFTIGSHLVRCTVTDAVGQAGCTFRVEVTQPSRRLRFKRFMAFGDSITMGFLRDPTGYTTALRPLYLSATENYPYILEQMLRARYDTNDIVVLNEGVGGETLPEGQDRIEETLARVKPEVILILEGYNDVHTIPVSDARSALRAIARTSQVNGVDVVLATLFQVSDDREDSRPGSQAAIEELNDRIRSLASSLGLGGVADLEVAFGSDRSLLGSDGLHPNPAGYQRIAETMRDEIIRRFEEIPGPPPAPTPAWRRYSSRRSGH